MVRRGQEWAAIVWRAEQSECGAVDAGALAQEKETSDVVPWTSLVQKMRSAPVIN